MMSKPPISTVLLNKTLKKMIANNPNSQDTTNLISEVDDVERLAHQKGVDNGQWPWWHLVIECKENRGTLKNERNQEMCEGFN